MSDFTKPNRRTGPRFPVPNIQNATLSHLIDEAAKYRSLKAEADFYDKFYSTAIKARLDGKSEYVGENYIAALTVSYTARISPDLCRELLDDDTLAKVTVTGETVTLRFVKKYEQPQLAKQETTDGH